MVTPSPVVAPTLVPVVTLTPLPISLPPSPLLAMAPTRLASPSPLVSTQEAIEEEAIKLDNEATEGGGGGDRQIRYALAGSGGVAADGGEGDGDEDGELRRVVGTDGGGDGNSGPDLAAPEADLRPPKGRSGVGQTRGDGVGDNRVNSRRESTSRRQQRHGARGDGGDSDDSRWLAGGNSGWRSRCGCQRRRRHDCGDR
ncbi:Os02g0257001 [Oryza sativa Japonica Group]|uniref:Os02g0257001 protein n=1 Tax=Oryza sativa subsp. japonica TaxID=39947 RepID=A0A0P0VH61_ORYSJ|nr:hypothetical protein EE612_010187 [Oryza sativa]BAS77959.1 Os02g0257001 [Oryza sativa Japonica Group]